MRSTLNMQFLGVRVPNLHPFHSMISRIQDIAHFRIFPLTPMLKFQSATFWGDCLNSSNFFCLMTALLFIKFGSNRIKTVTGVAF